MSDSDGEKTFCNMHIKENLGAGDIAGGVYLLDNGTVFKYYNNPEYTVSYLPEIDITRRLIHPGIIKTYRVVTREECINDHINHGLIMQFAPPEKIATTLPEKLRSLIMGLSAADALSKNGVKHNDWNKGNQYQTEKGYIIIDLNYEQSERIMGIDESELRQIYMPYVTNILDVTNRTEFINYVLKKGRKPNHIQLNISMTKLENELLYDLVSRLFSKDDKEFLYFNEIPYHPIFRLHGINPIHYSMEPRYINYDNFPAKYQDHQKIWKYHMDQEWYIPFEDYYNIFMMESIDLYYRFLPFVTNEDLYEVSRICMIIIAKLVAYNYIPNYIQIRNENIILDDKIIRSLNGQLRDRNFYHYAESDEDFDICWKLMFIPYDDYMSLNKDRFVEVVSPSGAVDYTTLIERMKMPTVNQKEYVFKRLSYDDLLYFAQSNGHIGDLYNDKLIAARICDRYYKYGAANPGTLVLTQAVIDLITYHDHTIVPTQLYDLDALLHMDDTKTLAFAQSLQLDPNIGDLRNRVIRVLRMYYLIKE